MNVYTSRTGTLSMNVAYEAVKRRGNLFGHVAMLDEVTCSSDRHLAGTTS